MSIFKSALVCFSTKADSSRLLFFIVQLTTLTNLYPLCQEFVFSLHRYTTTNPDLQKWQQKKTKLVSGAMKQVLSERQE